jgi:hypothetical protein
LSRKAVVNVSLMTKRLKRRCGSGWNKSQKDFYAAGFDTLVKRWDKSFNVGWGYVEKQMFFYRPSFEYRMFYVLRPFVTYLLTLSCTCFQPASLHFQLSSIIL